MTKAAAQTAERRADRLLAPKGWTLNLGARGGEIQAHGVFPTAEAAMADAQRQERLDWRPPDAAYAGYTALGARGTWLVSPDTSPSREGMYEKRRPRKIELSIEA